MTQLPLSEINDALAKRINLEILIPPQEHILQYLILDPELDVCVKFTHDHLREISYNNIAANRRTKNHLSIARVLAWLIKAFLVNKGINKENQNQIFNFVNHYSKSVLLIKDKEEKLNVIKLISLASSFALQSSAYEPALSYSRHAHTYCIRKIILAYLFTKQS